MPSSQFLELARERFVQAGLLSKTVQSHVIEVPLQQPSPQEAAEAYGLST
jgi:hypothetical protein